MTLENQNKKPAPWGFDAKRLKSRWQRKGVYRASAGGVPSRLSLEESIELVRLVQAGLAGARLSWDIAQNRLRPLLEPAARYLSAVHRAI